MTCKQCGSKSLNGTNFCKRICRTTWVREHNIKGAKRWKERKEEEFLMSFGLSSSACDKDSIGNY